MKEYTEEIKPVSDKVIVVSCSNDFDHPQNSPLITIEQDGAEDPIFISASEAQKLIDAIGRAISYGKTSLKP